MNDFQMLMFIAETGEFVDLRKYEIANLVCRRSKEVAGKVFVNKETGKEEFIQFRNGPIKRLPKIDDEKQDEIN